MWCYARQRGSKVEISEITDEFVKLNRKTVARPKPKNVELYCKLQQLQDQLGRDLRPAFAKHRALVS